MGNDKKLLEAKTEDLFRLCDKYSEARFSLFYNEAEAEVIRAYAGARPGYNTRFFGGYNDAERCIFGVFPEWEEPDEFPIAVLKAETKFSKTLSHRDYLGTVLSLGLDRGKVGDILVQEKCAYIFVMEDIADFVVSNITKIANCGVRLVRVTPDENNLPKREFEQIKAVAAAERLDAILAAALNISRRESALYINSGKVSVNHKLIYDTAFSLKEGDLMSVRGAGRIILDELGANTRSGRMHILLKKYVR